MRSVILVILTGLIIAGAFSIYVWREATHSSSSGKSNDPILPPPPLTPPSGLSTPYHNGTNAWIEIYDDKNGTLLRRMRAEEYIPQSDGQVLVKKPVAEFYPNNRMMRLTGETGYVVMPQPPPSSKQTSTAMGFSAPSRGQIQVVKIELFNLFPDSKKDVPDETILTNNIQFDNETMLITTESYKGADGREVPADEVPVSMRGEKYDFDGRGLKMRWNDKDGRLDLLEVAHGEKLVVKDAKAMSGTFGGETPEPKAEKPPMADKNVCPTNGRQECLPRLLRPNVIGHSGPGDLAPPLPTMLAANDKSAVAGALDAGGATSHATTQTTRPGVANAPPPPVPYVATFYDNVHITQGQDVSITADRMDLDFNSRNESAQPTTAPSKAATQTGTGSHVPASLPSELPATSDVARVGEADRATALLDATRPAPTTTPATHPSTQPAAQPIVIRWTGKLLMLPAKPDRPKVLPGDSVVELNGNPVVVRRTPTGQPEGDDIRAARVIYHTADASVKLVNSAAIPQVVISKLINGAVDPRTTVTTGTLDYTTGAGKKYAVLTGPGHAMVPMEPSAPKAGQPTTRPANEMMDARWKHGAKVYFTGKNQDELTIDHVDLSGDVDVKHPQLVMQSQALSLFFDPPVKSTTRPAVAPATRPGQKKDSSQELRRVTAHEAVHCELAGQNGKKQTIDCTDLEMLTGRSDDGKLFARQVNAKGGERAPVHAFDSEQELSAEVVELTMKPAKPAEKQPQTQPSTQTASDLPAHSAAQHVATTQTQPAGEEPQTASAELEKMIARENVLVINKKEGSKAAGSELIVTTEEGSPHVRLTGAPLANVIDAKQNVITGPLITIDPKQGIAHVVGAGNMHVLQEQGDGSKPRPMDVAWTDRADMNGPANRIDVIGDVIVNTLDADGTRNRATGETVRIDLVKKPAPATRPTTRPAAFASTAPSTRPARSDSMADSMQMDIMKDKEVRTITIDGDAKVLSTLQAPDGAVIRQFELLAPRIIYQLGVAGDPAGKTLLVPSAGRMIVRDHRPNEKPKPADKGKTNDDDEAGNRGDTAFRWNKRMTYAEADHRAVMTGDVNIVHQPQGAEAGQGPVRIIADQVTAWFAPQKREDKPPAHPATATAPATQKARIGNDPETAMQLSRLTAVGNVTIQRGQAALFADHVDYDPISHWMTAHGTDIKPAQYQDPDPKRSMAARDMQWNTQTWNMKATGPSLVNPK